MKRRVINENPAWDFWVPDSIAEWDAPSHWERERLASMRRHLRRGDALYDIGVEHGWLSAAYGSFCGHENMVLVEPSAEFWPNIRMTWQYNGLPGPLACFVAFCGAETEGEPVSQVWPDEADGPECGAMAYRTLVHHRHQAPTVTIDSMPDDKIPPPDALTIDVEGAELLVLQGAQRTLAETRPGHVWISVHPDLMERDFGHQHDDVHLFMGDFDYWGELLAVDHEEHWHYRPKELA